jgi:hypothetical protein
VLTGTEAASGDKVIDTKFEAAAVILRLAVDCCVPDFAVMVTVPEVDPFAMPPELTLATLESDELHCAELVMSFELPSE